MTPPSVFAFNNPPSLLELELVTEKMFSQLARAISTPTLILFFLMFACINNTVNSFSDL